MIYSHHPVLAADITRGASGWVGVHYRDDGEGDEVFHKVRWPIVVMKGESYRVYSESAWEVS